jgi:hypothetical protein
MKVFAVLIAAALASACASMAVSSDAIEERTAFALSLKKGDFTISDRRDSGVRTDYKVQAKSGAQYNCYVTGTVSVTGRIVSDAVCSAAAGSPAAGADNKVPSANNPACNALLKAAGRC